MSYNGIGLSSAKGSSTSGYVQTNLSSRGVRRYGHYEGRKHHQEITEYNERKVQATSAASRKADPDIIKHERERKVEIQCLTYYEELEDQGLEEDAIEEKVSALRAKLKAQLDTDENGHSGLEDSKNMHELSVAKKDKNERFERAIKNTRLHRGQHDNRHTWRPRERTDDRDEYRSGRRSSERSRSPSPTLSSVRRSRRDSYSDQYLRRDSRDASRRDPRDFRDGPRRDSQRDPKRDSRHEPRRDSGREGGSERVSNSRRESRSPARSPRASTREHSNGIPEKTRSPSPYSKRKHLRPYEE